MLLGGNVCFFVMYHYKTNAILTTPIVGLDLERILEAYTKKLRIFGEQRVQTESERNGQSGNQSYQDVPHPTVSGTPIS